MQRKRVLIIDDEDDIREVAEATLELTEESWDVQTADSGAHGIASARASRPDVILLDVMMPDMDGPATFGELQDDPAMREIPVIFLTAKVQTADRRRFTRLGVRGVIAKPFDPLTLANQVKEIVGW